MIATTPKRWIRYSKAYRGEKEFTINLRVVGLPPLSIYTHYILFNSPS